MGIMSRAKIFEKQGDWENAIQDYLTVLSNPERDQATDSQVKDNIGEIYFILAKSRYKK